MVGEKKYHNYIYRPGTLFVNTRFAPASKFRGPFTGPALINMGTALTNNGTGLY